MKYFLMKDSVTYLKDCVKFLVTFESFEFFSVKYSRVRALEDRIAQRSFSMCPTRDQAAAHRANHLAAPWRGRRLHFYVRLALPIILFQQFIDHLLVALLK